MDDITKELAALIAKQQDREKARDACDMIAVVAWEMMQSFLACGFERDEAFALLMVVFENGTIDDA